MLFLYHAGWKDLQRTQVNPITISRLLEHLPSFIKMCKFNLKTSRWLQMRGLNLHELETDWKQIIDSCDGWFVLCS